MASLQLGEDLQREHAVLVGEVRAEAQHELHVAVQGTGLGRRRGPWRHREHGVINAEMDDVSSAGVGQLLGERVEPRVLGEEHHAVCRRQRAPGEIAVALPGVPGREVAGVVEADEVLVGDQQPVAQPGEHGEIGRR